MATVSKQKQTREIDYPTGDGKPMAETELHLLDMIDIIQLLRDHFAGRPDVYVGGNLLLFYQKGNRRKHIAPDAFVVFGVPKEPPRDNYLVWEEGRGPNLVVEITSKSTRREDEKKKFVIYRDILKVPEYILFDPTEDYLHPSLQGFRLAAEKYVPIDLIAGRLPSEVLGLHLERDGTRLRLFDPVARGYLLTRLEALEIAERRAAEADHRAADAEAAQRRLADENERLRREIQQLRGA